jgi:dTDP-4-dehydrorhamnose 3,5-epimerase
MLSIFDHVADISGQVNLSVMYAGAVKAWHRHALQTDHWAVPLGNLKVGLFNSDAASIAAELILASSLPNAAQAVRLEIPPNSGQTVYLGEHRPGVLTIPPGVWHGGVAVGGRDAALLYYVTRKYDPTNPDEERADWNAFPFSWDVQFK